MKTLKTIAFILGIIAVTISLWNLYRIFSGYKKGDDSYANLKSYVTPATAGAAPTGAASSQKETDATAQSETAPTLPPIPFPEVDFAALRQINPSIVGWISCEGTSISYPIAQASDNRYYLEHLFTGEANRSGCIFLDCANNSDFSDRHSILYGHNMKNGAMFAGLMNYKDQDYYDAHPRFLLVTPAQNYTIEIFAGYVLSGWGNAWTLSFADDAEFEAWLQDSVRQSCFQSDITPTAQDRIVTLSTCSYEFDNARFVLLGILKEG